MSRLRKPRTLLALCVLALVVALLLSARTSAAADDEQHRKRGWTVWQGGAEAVYPFEDRWTAESHPESFTLSNAKIGVEIHYYGSFTVEHRLKDLD